MTNYQDFTCFQIRNYRLSMTVCCMYFHKLIKMRKEVKLDSKLSGNQQKQWMYGIKQIAVLINGNIQLQCLRRMFGINIPSCSEKNVYRGMKILQRDLIRKIPVNIKIGENLHVKIDEFNQLQKYLLRTNLVQIIPDLLIVISRQ